MSCSECWLRTQNATLNNPLGFEYNAASRFASLTSSCNSTTGYSVAIPTAYALNSTATTVPAMVTATPAPECTGSYIVQPTDTCNSVARALNVSTYNLVHYNNIDIYCRNFANTINQTIYQPPQCDTYTWKAIESCESVVGNFPGMTVPQFLAWNPNFSALCRNSLNFVGYEVCVR